MCLCGVPVKLISQVSQHTDVERVLLAVIETVICISLLSALIKFVASGNVHMKVHTCDLVVIFFPHWFLEMFKLSHILYRIIMDKLVYILI